MGESVQPVVRLRERRSHPLRGPPVDLDARVGARGAQSRSEPGVDSPGGESLALELVTRLGSEGRKHGPGALQPGAFERFLDAAAPDTASLCEPDAERRQDPGERVEQQRIDSQGLRDGAGVLAGRTAEG